MGRQYNVNLRSIFSFFGGKRPRGGGIQRGCCLVDISINSSFKSFSLVIMRLYSA